jgi:NAD(P)-dependent dehydrogenase (short-subunit alcohol dehydrogenase family)
MGRQAYSQVAEITEVGTIAGFAGAAEEQSGRVAIGVTNSRGPPSKILSDTKVEDWKSAVDQSLVGAGEFGPRDASTHADEQVGRPITFRSSAVKQPLDWVLLPSDALSALRAAVTRLAKTPASEYARSVISVN